MTAGIWSCQPWAFIHPAGLSLLRIVKSCKPAGPDHLSAISYLHGGVGDRSEVFSVPHLLQLKLKLQLSTAQYNI